MVVGIVVAEAAVGACLGDVLVQVEVYHRVPHRRVGASVARNPGAIDGDGRDFLDELLRGLAHERLGRPGRVHLPAT